MTMGHSEAETEKMIEAHDDDEDTRCICGGVYVFDRDTSDTRCDRCGHDIDDAAGVASARRWFGG